MHSQYFTLCRSLRPLRVLSPLLWQTQSVEAWPLQVPQLHTLAPPQLVYLRAPLPLPHGLQLFTLPANNTRQPASAPAPDLAAKSTTPRLRDVEPTTPRPEKLQVRNGAPAKLQRASKLPPAQDLRQDLPLQDAVRNINPEFQIEEIIVVPGRHVLSSSTLATKLQPFKTLKSMTVRKQPNAILSPNPNPNPNASPNQRQTQKQQHKQRQKQKQSQKPSQIDASGRQEAPMGNAANVLQVEAVGKTASSGTIPQIPFQNYFLPYLAGGRAEATGMRIAALILEPHSKAVVGNGGTAVSMPLSKAFLRRGVPTNVYFNPESVAIAGVGGKAHAQADLELNVLP